MNNYSLIFSLFFIFSTGCKTDLHKKENQEKFKELSLNNQSKIEAIDSLVQTLINDQNAAGASLGIEIANFEPILETYGLANISTKEKVSTNHKFRIASITKMFTATAIAQLVQDEKLSFDDTLDKFFPNFPNGNKITIYHLLSHTSGIPNWYETTMPNETPKEFPMCLEPHRYIEKMDNISLYESGELYSYSNTGYIILGELIEIISKNSYEQFIKERIFEPSGMLETEMERDENMSEQWSKGYSFDDKKTIPFIEPEVYPMPFSAGGFRSTPTDLLKFIKALYSGILISDELRDKMTTYAKVNSGKNVDLDQDTFYFPSDFVIPETPSYLKRFGYGLGFQKMDIFDEAAVWHGGAIAGFESVILYLPESKTTITLLTNTGQGGGYGPIWEQVQKLITQIDK